MGEDERTRDVREWLASDPRPPLWPQPAVFTREDILRYVDRPFPPLTRWQRVSLRCPWLLTLARRLRIRGYG
jgi:hypothetical protein